MPGSRNHAREIERKFLIKRLPENLKRLRHYEIAQGYLVLERGRRHVRVRKQNRKATLTFKANRGASREEREIALTPKQFEMLWPATVGRRLYKTRYELRWKRSIIEIDLYRRRNRGLVVAEVEFASEASRHRFKPPPWFGREVTGERRFSNPALARE